MKKFLALLALALLLRFLFIPQPGFAADIAFWKSWSLAAVDKGIVWTTQETNYNYAPAFLYFLKSIGWLARIFSTPGQFNQYWDATNFGFLLVIKLPVIIADLLIGWGLWWLLKKQKLPSLKIGSRQVDIPLLAAGFWLFNPFIIFNGSYWGQVGSIGTGLVFLAMILIFQKKPVWGIGVATLAFLLKLQMMFFLPLLLLWIFQKFGWQKMINCLAAMVGVFFAVSAPFIIQNQMGKVISLILNSAAYFPFLSLNAYNSWWLFAKGDGFSTSDKVLVFGITSANSLGLFLFLVCLGLALVLVWQKTNRGSLYKAGAWIAFGFFMLPTQMHERYLYPIFLFLALLIPETIRLFREKKPSVEAYLYLSLILVLPWSGFYNLHNVLFQNYPEYGWALLGKLDILNLTMAIAAVHTFLFTGLSLLLLKEIGPKWRWSILGGVLCLLVFKQISFWTAKQIPLTKIQPTLKRQDYGIPMVNQTVHSAWGHKYSSFLSSNYYFYRQGIGTHANSKLVYPLDKKFDRFTVDIGVDSEAGKEASVVFKILGDDQELYSSPAMGRFDLPLSLQIDVRNIKELELLVTDNQDGILHDHADWLNPILHKQNEI